MVRIQETEAYIGRMDKACHAYNYRRTPGRRPYSPHRAPPISISFYGMYHCLNFCDRARGRALCRPDRGGQPRGKSFLSGPEPIWRRLGEQLSAYQRKNFLNGPGKLCQALAALTRAENGCSLLGDGLFVCDRLEDLGLTTPPEDLRPFSIVAGPRVGIDYAEEAVDFPWRYLLSDRSVTSAAVRFFLQRPEHRPGRAAPGTPQAQPPASLPRRGRQSLKQQTIDRLSQGLGAVGRSQHRGHHLSQQIRRGSALHGG